MIGDITPVLPLLSWHGLWLIGFLVFLVQSRIAPGAVDDSVVRKRSKLIGAVFQPFLMWMLGPVERLLIRRRVAPNLLTGLSVVLALAASLLLALGWFGLGGWLYLATGIADILDGRVARATQRVSDAGAFADSVGDRLAEASIFAGLAWFYSGTWVLALVLGALVASFLVSYTRARGEGLGMSGADIGAMQRPERILFLSLTVIHSPIVGLFLSPEQARMAWPAVLGLGLVAIASAATALRRFTVVYRALAGRAPVPVRELRTVRAPSLATSGPTPPHVVATPVPQAPGVGLQRTPSTSST